MNPFIHPFLKHNCTSKWQCGLQWSSTNMSPTSWLWESRLIATADLCCSCSHADFSMSDAPLRGFSCRYCTSSSATPGSELNNWRHDSTDDMHSSTVTICQHSHTVVMGETAKKKTIWFSATNNLIRFDSLFCQNPPPQSTPGVLGAGPEAAGPVHRSHDRPASIATELVTAFAEATTLTQMWVVTRSCSTVMHVAKAL